MRLAGGLFLLGLVIFVIGLEENNYVTVGIGVLMEAACGVIASKFYKPGVARFIRCPNCGYEGPSVRRTRGSIGIEAVLWLCFLLPGLIYSLWRASTRAKTCPRCSSEHVVSME